jgi:hypothetical protein
MSKIDLFESLKKILPSDSVNEVTSAVDALLAEAKDELKTQLEAEFNSKLEEAYTELSQELAEAEKTAVEGYQEAYNVINDLRNRLELQKEEFEKTLEEGYEEAYDMWKAEKAKNSTLEVDLHEEYTNKFNEVRTLMVDKLDEFLAEKGHEIYEQARRDILSDPRYAEHKVALDKIVEVTSNYLSDEEQTFATGAKLEEAARQIEDLKAQVKFMEARQIRLSGENHKLQESVRLKESQLNEATESDRKERAKKAKNVSGRGFIDKGPKKQDILAEYNNSHVDDDSDDDADTDDDQLFEGYEGADLDTINLLAGTKETKRAKKARRSS